MTLFPLLSGIPTFSPAVDALYRLEDAKKDLQAVYADLRGRGDKADASRFGRLALAADSLHADLLHSLLAIEAEAAKPVTP